MTFKIIFILIFMIQSLRFQNKPGFSIFLKIVLCFDSIPFQLKTNLQIKSRRKAWHIIWCYLYINIWFYLQIKVKVISGRSLLYYQLFNFQKWYHYSTFLKIHCLCLKHYLQIALNFKPLNHPFIITFIVIICKVHIIIISINSILIIFR